LEKRNEALQKEMAEAKKTIEDMRKTGVEIKKSCRKPEKK